MSRQALMRGKLVGQQVGVGSHHRVTHFDGPAVGVISSPDQPEHRDAGGQAQQPGLLGGRHPGGDFLGEPGQGMPVLFKPGVDSARPWVRVADWRPSRQVGRDVGDSSFDGPAVEGVPARADHGAIILGQVQAFGHLSGRASLAYLDHVYRRVRLALLGFGEESGLAFLAVPLSKAVRRKAPHRRPSAHIDAPTMLSRDQALVLQDAERVPDSHAGDTVVGHEPYLGRQLLALAQPALRDRGTQVIGDLPVNGAIASGVDVLGEHAVTAHCDLAPQLVHTSTTVSVPGKDQKIRTSHAQHSVSVAGVIVDEQNRVLLIRRRDNLHWEPPGGVLEVNESIYDGLLREIREETGLTVEPAALTGVYKNMNHGIIALVFRCRTVSGSLSTNSEVTDFRWATLADVTTMVSEAFAIRVLDALNPDSNPAIRQHDGVRLV